jgi:hypothetical protein
MLPNSKVLGLMLLHKHALMHELILASFCKCYDYLELVKGKLQLKQFILSLPNIIYVLVGCHEAVNKHKSCFKLGDKEL